MFNSVESLKFSTLYTTHNKIKINVVNQFNGLKFICCNHNDEHAQKSVNCSVLITFLASC